jgi:EAL domain-containing protein (putative c-di-GMP-specific phosphodiesterase class I)
VRNVIRLLKQLDYIVLAEGVEDLKTVEILRNLGCDEVQGIFTPGQWLPLILQHGMTPEMQPWKRSPEVNALSEKVCQTARVSL